MMAPPIHRACLPQLNLGSKMEVGSPERTAAYMLSQPKTIIIR